MGALGLSIWQSMGAVSSLRVIWAWTVWGICWVLALWLWAREQTPDGQLVWTGEQWFWQDAQGAESALVVQLLLDAGNAMVVRILPVVGANPHAIRIAWLYRQRMPRNWHGFRCAVYSRQHAQDKPANFVQDV
ncbi:hypothetical protein B9Z51_03320 [Limnohabitans sp. T6-5]|nr:hypothetical protein B9Z51_03320 [Limnohabitans sp. T6-5]